MNQITRSSTSPIVAVFESEQSIRIILIDNEPWFVAVDVANALNFRDAPNMTRMLDDDEKGTHIVRTLGGNQELTIISESGLYHAVLKSRKPEAKVFRKWVTSEVLPSIRKTGCYVAPVAAPTQDETIVITESEAEHLRKIVGGIAYCLPTMTSIKVAAAIYGRIKSPLRIGRIDDLPALYLDKTTSYLERILADARRHSRQQSSEDEAFLSRMIAGSEVAA